MKRNSGKILKTLGFPCVYPYTSNGFVNAFFQISGQLQPQEGEFRRSSIIGVF